MKKILSIILIFALLGSVVACGNDSKQETVQVDITEYLKYDYEEVELSSLLQDIDENVLRAQEYEGKYIKFSGYSQQLNMYLDGKYESIDCDFVIKPYYYSQNPEMNWKDMAVFCTMNQNDIEDYRGYNHDDNKINVWGKITDVNTDLSIHPYYTIEVLHHEFDQAPADIKYETYLAQDIFDNFCDNYALASTNAQYEYMNMMFGKYICVTGAISEVGTDDVMISDSKASMYHIGTIYLNYTNDTQKGYFAQKNVSDNVTIEGKISRVNLVTLMGFEALALTIDINNIVE